MQDFLNLYGLMELMVKQVKLVTKKSGGQGAVRELVDLILAKKSE